MKKIHKNTKHGMFGTLFYRKFRSIIARCYYPCSQNYISYGGRGIGVEWKNFQEFYDDMYSGYQKHGKKHGFDNTTIERIDNNKNYSKNNCRWITKKEQYENKRNLRMLTFNGKTQYRAKWARELGINVVTIKDRQNAGWSDFDTLTQKPSPIKLKKRASTPV